MAASKQLVRAACFSHREPFLISVEDQLRCQVMVVLTEYKTGEFLVNVEIFFLDQAKAQTSDKHFSNIREALKFVDLVFGKMKPFSAPEVLYLPEWSVEEEVEKVILKWTDGLFGWGEKKDLTIP